VPACGLTMAGDMDRALGAAEARIPISEDRREIYRRRPLRRPDWIHGIRKAGIEAINCLMGPREFGHYKTIVSALGETDRGIPSPGTPFWLRSRCYYTCVFIQPIQPAENA
jgi:hypothetical protein